MHQHDGLAQFNSSSYWTCCVSNFFNNAVMCVTSNTFGCWIQYAIRFPRVQCICEFAHNKLMVDVQIANDTRVDVIVVCRVEGVAHYGQMHIVWSYVYMVCQVFANEVYMNVGIFYRADHICKRDASWTALPSIRRSWWLMVVIIMCLCMFYALCNNHNQLQLNRAGREHIHIYTYLAFMNGWQEVLGRIPHMYVKRRTQCVAFTINWHNRQYTAYGVRTDSWDIARQTNCTKRRLLLFCVCMCVCVNIDVIVTILKPCEILWPTICAWFLCDQGKHKQKAKG